MLRIFTLNVRLSIPLPVIGGGEQPLLGYVKTVLVEAATTERCVELAVQTVTDGEVKEASSRECEHGTLPAASAKVLGEAGPGLERVAVLGGLIFYGDGALSPRPTWLKRLLSRVTRSGS